MIASQDTLIIVSSPSLSVASGNKHTPLSIAHVYFQKMGILARINAVIVNVKSSVVAGIP
jgi:hypothetical protein